MVQSDSAAICVAGAVIRDGKVLLVHRSPSARSYPDVWDLFGGHVDGCESLEEALPPGGPRGAGDRGACAQMAGADQ